MASDSSQTTLSSRVEQIIHQHIGSTTELTPETDLFNDLAIDSLELVELGLRIEKQFGKKLPIADLRGCVTVGELTELVQRVTSVEQVENV